MAYQENLIGNALIEAVTKPLREQEERAFEKFTTALLDQVGEDQGRETGRLPPNAPLSQSDFLTGKPGTTARVAVGRSAILAARDVDDYEIVIELRDKTTGRKTEKFTLTLTEWNDFAAWRSSLSNERNTNKPQQDLIVDVDREINLDRS